MFQLSAINFLTILAWSIAAAWLAGLCWTRFCPRRQQAFGADKTRRSDRKPLVSVIVPARNEAHRVLKKSLRSMLGQTYENFEIIVLEDRSTDNTKEIVEHLFAGESKFPNLQSAILIDGVEPPTDWLGKPFALAQALKHAGGEWILTADADIVLAPETLQTVVEYVEVNNFDALTLAPKLLFGSFWETLFLPVFAWFCILAMPLHRANDPKRKESIGFGNFFMFRRETLEKIGGFETVKSEVAEDLKLAEILKEKGFNLRADYAPDLIETRMYAGFSEIWAEFTKNLFSGLKFSLPKTVSSVFSIFVCGILPVFAAFVALFFGQFQIFIPLAAVYTLQIITFAIVQKNWRGHRLYALLTPLGLLLFAAILLNSMIKVLSGRGVEWKGRAIYEAGGTEWKKG